MSEKISANRFNGVDTNTVAINDYRMVTSDLAEIVVSVTGDMDRNQISHKLVLTLGEQGTPVQGSFRWLNDRKHVAVGFISTRTPPRFIESESELAAYRHVASNMYMDETDESTWELKQGTAGKYLARHGADELPAVLSTVRRPRGLGVPSVSKVQRPQPMKGEYVCFVTSRNEIDYGFAVGKDKHGNHAIVTKSSMGFVAVSPSKVISTTEVEIPAHSKLPVLSGVPDPDAMRKYYKLAYQHSQAYIAEIEKQISEMAAA